MTHELILKRDNGDSIKIEVKLVTFASYMNETDRAGNKFRYDIMVWLKQKGKRI